MEWPHLTSLLDGAAAPHPLVMDFRNVPLELASEMKRYMLCMRSFPNPSLFDTESRSDPDADGRIALSFTHR